MISLLERIAVGEADAGLATDTESRRALRLLEWPLVCEQIAAFCHNVATAERVRARQPFRRLEAIRLRWQLADELRPSGERNEWPPLIEIGQCLDVLGRPAPLRLEGDQLVLIAGVAEGLDELRRYLTIARQTMPTLAEAALQMGTFSGLSEPIRRALDRDGHIVDGASPLLRRLRREARTREDALRRAVEAEMERARRQGWTTGPAVAMRGDRYCLPMASGQKMRVNGIVHDRSATGGTLFIEPAAVVSGHNELSDIRLQISAEELRILAELNGLVEQASAALDEGCRFLLLVDETRAALLWSRRCEGRRPVITEGGRLRICRGRHPLLLQFGPGAGAGSEEGAIVPLDLEMPENRRVVILSGPNAGGKSVSLKTVGVFQLLAQSGWDLPAREDTEVPLVTRLRVDLGDEQSIEQSLSSFSAHLGHLADFVRDADERTLVLCDEIGSGTDPQEGTAIAFAVLETLAERGATVLASTHFGLLKAAVDEHPQMINAAMDFDEETLQPRFTFRLGVPGASHAFAIASRCGFPPGLLQRARGFVGEERFRIESLLGDLEKRARAAAEAQQEAEQLAAAAHEDGVSLKRRLKEIERERKAVLAEVRREGDSLLQQARRRIEGTVRELRTGGADKVAIRSARDRVREIGDSLPEIEPETGDGPATDEVIAGRAIRVPHLGLTGTVVEVRGSKVVAEADGLRLNLPLDAIEVLPDGDGAPADETPTVEAGSWNWADTPPDARPEIDLRGSRGEEGWQQVDMLIDRAIPAGINELRVIHGVGTGRLRAHLLRLLADDRRVRSTREAPLEQGGHGVTIIRLAD